MSESVYENAKLLAQNGIPVFPSSRHWTMEAINLATTDMDKLESMHHVDASCNWRVRCGIGLCILDSPRECDFATLIREWGVLPPTLIVRRPSGGTHRWFRLEADDAEPRTRLALLGTRAVFKASAPVPGSVHGRSGEPYEVVNGDLERIALARLPDGWREVVPKQGDGITAVVTPRWEFTPSPSF